MGSNETNLHRAARKLQRLTGLPYQQARNLLQHAGGRPDLDDPAVVATLLASPAIGADQAVAGEAASEVGGSDEVRYRVVIDDGIGHTDDTFTGADLPPDLAAALERHPLDGDTAFEWQAPDGGTWTVTRLTSPVEADDYFDAFDESDPLFGEYTDFESCIAEKTHLTSCDDDGYCNYCGYQDPDPHACTNCGMKIEADAGSPTGWTHVETSGRSGGRFCNPEYTLGNLHTLAEAPTDD